jgi:hypothetical protein
LIFNVLINIYMCVCENVYYSRSEGQKKKGMKKWCGRQPEAMDTMAGPRSAPKTSAGGLRFTQVLQNETSHRQTSQTDFRSWGMSWTGSIPRSTRELEIPTTSCDSCSASAVRSPLIPSTHMRVSSGSAAGLTHRGDAGCMPTPLPVLSLAPPGPSPVGKGESGIPPMSS